MRKIRQLKCALRVSIYTSLLMAALVQGCVAPTPAEESGNETTESLLNPHASPGFGEVLLDANASIPPEPVSITDIISGGDIDASGLGAADCVGFTGVEPDISLEWTGSGFLRIFFVPDDVDRDTTLIINDAQGNWHCNDDSFETPHPTIDFNEADTGRYDVWVGSYNEGETTSGSMYVTRQDYSPVRLPGTVREVEIPLALNPSTRTLSAENEVVISVNSDEWEELSWRLFPEIGELLTVDDFTVIFIPSDESRKANISVTGRTADTSGSASVSFSIEPACSSQSGLNYCASPRFNYINLNMQLDSISDPYPITGIISGGDIDASGLGAADCVGFTHVEPDISLEWTGSGFLRIFFVPDDVDSDTTLIMNDAQGEWHCNDDSFETPHPTIDFNEANSGKYDIWVGSYNEGETISGSIYITRQDITPQDMP